MLGLDAYGEALTVDGGTDALDDSTFGPEAEGVDSAGADRASDGAAEDSTTRTEAGGADGAGMDQANDAAEDSTIIPDSGGSADAAGRDQASDTGGHDASRDGSPADASSDQGDTSPADAGMSTCQGPIPPGADTCCGTTPCVGLQGNTCNCSECDQLQCTHWCCFGSQGGGATCVGNVNACH
jgi:hypothetical protein